MRDLSARLIVAAAGAGERWLEIADVVALSPADSIEASALLRRYPGCAVVAAGRSPGQCRLTARQGSPVTLTVHGGCGCPLPCHAVLCGVLAHAWLTAGLPLAALDGTIAQPVRPVPPGWRRGLAHDGVLSVSLAPGDTPGDRASCRCLTAAVSGAPSPE